MNRDYVHISLSQYDAFRRLGEQLEDAQNESNKGKNMVRFSSDWSGYLYAYVTDEVLAEKLKEADKYYRTILESNEILRSRIKGFGRLPWYRRIFKKP